MISSQTSILHLSAAIFRDNPSELTLAELQELHLERFALYFLSGQLPREDAASLRSESIAYSITDMKQEAACRNLGKLFQASQIRFCPLKGADLAWRVYPAGGLRPKCDLDILVHPEDVKRAAEILAADGWETPFQYRDGHHLPQMRKNGVMLELHFHLPHGEHIPNGELWREMQKTGESSYRLPLEWNLAMLFHHARNHCWCNGIQLLMDTAFLVKAEGTPDWQKLQEIEEKFQLAAPKLLFGAFSDFFPAEMLPPELPPDEVTALFRSILLAEICPRQFILERIMEDEKRFSLPWWRERLKGMGPASIRIQTGNPRGHYGKLLIGYVQVASRKWKTFWSYRRGSIDPATTSRLKAEKSIENFLR